MVAAAKAGGDGRALLPHGIQSVDEVPWDLARGIDHAHRVLSWQEHLSKEEVPPKWMWPHEEELVVWFEEVQIARDEKYGGGSDTSNGDYREAPVEGMMSNAASDRRR